MGRGWSDRGSKLEFGGVLLETVTSLPLVLLVLLGAFDLCSISSHYFLTKRALNVVARDLAIAATSPSDISITGDPGAMEQRRGQIEQEGSRLFKGLFITTISAQAINQTVESGSSFTPISRSYMQVIIDGAMTCISCRIFSFGQVQNLTFHREVIVPLENQ